MEFYMEEKIIRRKALEAKLGLACSTIYAMMGRGEFPKPVKLGRRAVGWREQDIGNWLKNRKVQSDD